MNETTVRAPRELLGPPSQRVAPQTRRLLTAGVVAGPLYAVVVAVQMAAVPWFDLTTQPLSVLNLGELGWLQKANWMVAGLLVICAAVGLRRTLRRGPARTWTAVLVAAFGVGLIGAGVFDVDPGGGVPPGAPEAVPTEYSWHMYAHNLFSMLAFIALAVATLVLARRFWGAGRRGWTVCSAATGAVSFAMFFLPTTDGMSLRLAFATVLMFGWVAAVCLLVRSSTR